MILPDLPLPPDLPFRHRRRAVRRRMSDSDSPAVTPMSFLVRSWFR